MSTKKENAVEQYLDSLVRATTEAKPATQYPIPSSQNLQDFLLNLTAPSAEYAVKRNELIRDLEKLTGKPFPVIAIHQ